MKYHGKEGLFQHSPRELAAILEGTEVPQNPLAVVDVLIDDGRLSRFLQLPEAPERRVYDHRGGASRQEIPIPVADLLRDWLQGVDLLNLADTYFSAVQDLDFRFEQLGDYINDYFEIHLPWVFGTVLAWTNAFLEQAGSTTLLPKTIPAHVRWGVGDATALRLMIRGIQSRTLASRIAQVWQAEERDRSLRSWIRSMRISEWQQEFGASDAELRDILNFSRPRTGGISVDLVNQGVVEFEVDSKVSEMSLREAALILAGESEVAPIHVRIGGDTVGRVRSRDLADVHDVLETGLAISVEFSASSGTGQLRLELVGSEA
jgi:hypothetical protein